METTTVRIKKSEEQTSFDSKAPEDGEGDSSAFCEDERGTMSRRKRTSDLDPDLVTVTFVTEIPLPGGLAITLLPLGASTSLLLVRFESLPDSDFCFSISGFALTMISAGEGASGPARIARTLLGRDEVRLPENNGGLTALTAEVSSEVPGGRARAGDEFTCACACAGGWCVYIHMDAGAGASVAEEEIGEAETDAEGDVLLGSLSSDIFKTRGSRVMGKKRG